MKEKEEKMNPYHHDSGFIRGTRENMKRLLLFYFTFGGATDMQRAYNRPAQTQLEGNIFQEQFVVPQH